MSTRSQIGFYDSKEKKLDEWDALLYRHYDGYPAGMLPDLFPVLQDFNKNRGLDDTEYASAWVCAKLKTDYLNVGISKQIHGDIEYFYAVYPTELRIYGVPCTHDIKKFKLITSLDYSESLPDL